MKKTQKNIGFTLIELVIAVAIIGILSAIAYPSYSSYIVRAHRSDAMEALNEVMAQQQRYVLRKRTYSIKLTDLGYGSDTITTDAGFYTIKAEACGAGSQSTISRCVILTAEPVVTEGQKDDGDMTLNSRGDKTWNGKVGWFHRV